MTRVAILVALLPPCISQHSGFPRKKALPFRILSHRLWSPIFSLPSSNKRSENHNSDHKYLALTSSSSPNSKLPNFHHVRIAQVANTRQYSNFTPPCTSLRFSQPLPRPWRTRKLTVRSMIFQVAKPLWPFGVAAALTFYLVSGLQDAAVQCEYAGLMRIGI